MTDKQPSPRPWRSVLIPHLDEIRKMRRARHTWKEIARHLGEVHGLSLAPPTIYLFFKRATRRTRLPLGFEDSTPTAQPSSVTAVKPGSYSTQEPQHNEPPGHQKISVMPVDNKPKEHPIFGSWTPEQGINYKPKDF